MHFASLSALLLTVVSVAAHASDNGRAPATAATATVQQGDTAWWSSFCDPALSAVIEKALLGSPTIEAAAARLDQARAAARSTRASLLPSLGASGSAGAQRPSLDDPAIRPFVNAPEFQPDVERYELGLRAAWEIDLFGAKPRLRATRARTAGAAADLAAARIAVTADVASTYFSILELRERVAIARARAESLDRQTAALRLRVAQGVTAPLELDRFAGETGSARAAVPGLEIVLAAATARLGVLAGVEAADAVAALVPQSARLPSAETSGDSVNALTVSLERRPDVAAAGYRLAASRADVSSARARRYPRFSLGGLLATIVSGPAALFSSSSTAAQGAGSFSLNLFDSGAIDAEVAAARGRERESLSNYRATLLTAASEIGVTGKTVAFKRAEASERAAAKATLQRAVRTAQATYDAGALDLTAVLDTDRASQAATEAAAISKGELARAIVALIRATAGSEAATTEKAASLRNTVPHL